MSNERKKGSLDQWRANMFVLYGLACFVMMGFANETMGQPLPGEHSVAPKDWKVLTLVEGIKTLDMIADQTQGNYERIHTWKGTYAVRQQEYLPRESVAVEFRRELKEGDVSALWRISDRSFHFALDMASGSIYRSNETRETKWTRVDSNELIKIPNISSVDERSVVTSEDYLHFDPNAEWPRFAAVQDFPLARNKRAAFRDPRENSQRQEHGDLMDPRNFFGFGGRFWDKARLVARALKGELGEDVQRKKTERIALYSGVGSDGAVWYRMDDVLNGPRNSPEADRVYLTYLWDSAAGFNPVSLSMTRDKAGKERSERWRWKQFGSIFVPFIVEEENYSSKTGHLSFRRTVELQECSVNEPVEQSQFSYAGLGMKDGDLVMDNIAKACYVIEKGSLKKVANFGEKYIPPRAGGSGVSKGWQMTITISLVVVLIAVFIVRRYRKRVA